MTPAAVAARAPPRSPTGCARALKAHGAGRIDEEIGLPLDRAPSPLCSVRQAGGKRVDVFAVEGDLDPKAIVSIHFEMEWPPRSGEWKAYPEAEEARWMSLNEARRMMLPSQLPILDALETKLADG